MRKIAILPALLTLGNGICGFAAIAIASRIGNNEFSAEGASYFSAAGWLILLAMVFDMLDGHVARLSRTASKFGGELDSLCDAVSFGVAPAFMLLKMGPGWEPSPPLHQLVIGIAALYMSCTLLRLARFNVDNTPDPASHKRFKGLPSPGAAGCLATLAIFRGSFPNLAEIYRLDIAREDLAHFAQRAVEAVSPLVALVVALLMVSRVPYPHVTKQIFKGKRHVGHLIQVLLTLFIFVMIRQVALLIVFWGYALGVPLWVMLNKNVRAPMETANQIHIGEPPL
jgi:CDP-diacylglycerol--serine O-phosphatidyltransferase